MCVQVALLQRFSVLLGHPTYALAVVLFSMILFAGLGSGVSERLVGTGGRRFAGVAWGLAAALAVIAAAMPAVCATAVAWPLAARVGVVIAIVAPLAVLMGCAFPHGARLVQRRDADALAWMWGANGAAGVVASIAAVMISMTLDIETNLWLAALAYALLPLAARRLALDDRPRVAPASATTTVGAA
jgi:hypothetical protein